MSFTNIKLKSNEGFTIVELLIVVVVIAILAAITIVSYNGITNKSHASAAQATAATLQKKIGLYNADKGTYPTGLATLTSTAGTDASQSWYVPTGTIKVVTGTPDSSFDEKTVQVVPCTTVGMKINYYTWGSPATGTILVGDTSGTCTGTWAAAS